MKIDESGWITEALQIPSVNFDERPDNEISLLVIHSISLPPMQFGGSGITSLFTNSLDPMGDAYYSKISNLRVSSHLLIRRNGALIQYVSLLKKAWHAGISAWYGRERCNDFSIGIELEGGDDALYDQRQYKRLNQVLELLMRHYDLTGIAGHNEIAPGRKTDPGELFDWMQLASSAQHLRQKILKKC